MPATILSSQQPAFRDANSPLWILFTGEWNDNGVWVDVAEWVD